MGWITFVLCLGMRVDLQETSAKSLEEFCTILNDIRDDSSNPTRSQALTGVTLSSLKTNFKGTEFEMCDRNYAEYDAETFGALDSKDDCYMLYYAGVELDNSNGDNLNTNMAYSSGHLEFYHGVVESPLDPTAAQVDLFQEIARRAGMEYELNFSLRTRGCNADTKVWPK